jgi:hypothetical protein
MIPGTQNEFLGAFGIEERGSVLLSDSPDREATHPDDPITRREIDYMRGYILANRMRASVDESVMMRPSASQRREMEMVVTDEEVIRRIRERRAIEARYHRETAEAGQKRKVSRKASGGQPIVLEQIKADGIDSRQFKRKISYGPGYEPPLDADAEGSAFTRVATKNQYRRTLSKAERQKWDEIWDLESEEEEIVGNHLDPEVSSQMLRDLLGGVVAQREHVQAPNPPQFDSGSISQITAEQIRSPPPTAFDRVKFSRFFAAGFSAFVALIILYFIFKKRSVKRAEVRRERAESEEKDWS